MNHTVAVSESLTTPEEELLYIPGDPPSLRLGLRHLAPADGGPARAGRVVLSIHGATFPAALAIGYRFDGHSWMDDLSNAGFDTWALDFPGYGESDRYPAMRASAATDAPPGRAPEASQQIACAVAAIIERQGIAKVSLIAHSWGTMAAGSFAAAHPEHVDRLVLFGPVTLRHGLAPSDTPAYHDITLAAQWQRFTADVPAGEPPVLLQRHFDLWGSAYLATDPTSGTRTPPSVRTPGGPTADSAAAKRGEFPYDPAAIVAPTLIVRGEWDSVTTDADARWLFDALTAASVKQDVKIARATHLMHLEEGRYQLYRAVQYFLEGGDRPDDPPMPERTIRSIT